MDLKSKHLKILYQRWRILNLVHTSIALDIKMRDMDGFELYDKLRKMDNNISDCFLTATSEYYGKYKQRYPWLAKECFITKPVAFERLVNTINSVLN